MFLRSFSRLSKKALSGRKGRSPKAPHQATSSSPSSSYSVSSHHQHRGKYYSLEHVGCVMVWFNHNDLRLHDHYPLSFAAKKAKELNLPLIAAFCFDMRCFAQPSLVGGFFRTSPGRVHFLEACVQDVREQLASFGCAMYIRTGIPEEEIPELAARLRARFVFSTFQYAPHESIVQKKVGDALEEMRRGGYYLPHKQHTSDENPKRKIEEEEDREQQSWKEIDSSNNTTSGVLQPIWGDTLVHIDDLSTSPHRLREAFRWFFDEVEVAPIRPTKPYEANDGRLGHVGSEHVKECMHRVIGRQAFIAPRTESEAERVSAYNVPLGFLPSLQDLGYGNEGRYSTAETSELFVFGGETAALERVESWLEKGGLYSFVAPGFQHSRRSNMRGGVKASQLSPYLATGALSPRKLYEEMRAFSFDNMGSGVTESQFREGFFRLARRDFWHFMGVKYGRALFFPYGPRPELTGDLPDYRLDEKIVRRWCDGLTGIPFADAAMKELVSTGFVAHEGRCALAWLLTRGYGQDWRVGAEWFERCSMDYDPFVCYGNFAYQAELIRDRFGDPVRTVSYVAHRNDQTGLYIKRWLPHLMRIPPWYIHRVHVITEKMQAMHRVQLGVNYPYPIKLWDGAPRHLALPSYYGDPDRVQQLLGWGEAEKFSTKRLENPSFFRAYSAASASGDKATLKDDEVKMLHG